MSTTEWESVLHHRRQIQLPGALNPLAPEMGLLAVRTKRCGLAGSRGGELEQFGHGCGACLMHGRAHGYLQSSRVPTANFAAGI